MTSQHVNGRTDDDPAAERLSTAWDHLVTGVPPNVDDVDPELLCLARRLSDRPVAILARSAFRQELKETIMQSPSVALTTRPLRHVPVTGQPLPGEPRPALGQIPRLLARTGMRWVATAATVALLLTTAAGGYLSGIGRPGDGGTGTNVAAPLTASPEAGGAPELLGCGPDGAFDSYVPCALQLPNIVARSGILGDFPAEDLAVTKVQMQRWQIGGGQAVAFKEPMTQLDGIGLDVVINGAYTARFSGPVTVTDDQSRIRGLYTYVPINTFIELVTGDVVTYELGTKLEIRNPLAETLLQFKTIQFYDGSPTPENVVASGGDFRAVVDGNGSLPQPINAYGEGGMQIVLSYSQIIPGYPFPPEWLQQEVIILGPVDPVGGPTGTEGFILWVFEVKG